MRKKHLQNINSWFNQYKSPPVGAIKGNRDHYAGLWIRPWYGIKKKNPPLPVFLAMLDALSRMYDEWDKAFKKAGYPYDLQLWVYDEHMIESQLVCAGVEKHGDRRTNYFTDCPEQYKFQSGKYFKYGHFDPDDFEWTAYEVRNYLYEKLDELTEKQIKKLLSNDWHEDICKPGTEEQERYFWRIHDFVWVGRKLRVES
ncbi:MAG: hypothetical protein K9N05_07550 [Candidatus Marinimicrobia bacterium]|nr:hypothetical protein [Candidatus Neomarinimicrobiota bacterium]